MSVSFKFLKSESVQYKGLSWRYPFSIQDIPLWGEHVQATCLPLYFTFQRVIIITTLVTTSFYFIECPKQRKYFILLFRWTEISRKGNRIVLGHSAPHQTIVAFDIFRTWGCVYEYTIFENIIIARVQAYVHCVHHARHNYEKNWHIFLSLLVFMMRLEYHHHTRHA